MNLTSEANIAWEFNGQRLCISSEAFLYFVNIKYTFTSAILSASKLVVACPRPENKEKAIYIINLLNASKNVIPALNVIHLMCFNEYILLVSLNPQLRTSMDLRVLNQYGDLITTTTAYFNASLFDMNPTHVFFASLDVVYTWCYQTENGPTPSRQSDIVRIMIEYSHQRLINSI
jgi:hypothetical protein